MFTLYTGRMIARRLSALDQFHAEAVASGATVVAELLARQRSRLETVARYIDGRVLRETWDDCGLGMTPDEHTHN